MKETFVLVFRAGKKQLAAAEQKARTEEVRQWALLRLKEDPKFEPRVLGEQSYHVGSDGKANLEDDSVIALNFIEANDFSEAVEIAKSHPGLRYGVDIEVRPWRDPRSAAPPGPQGVIQGKELDLKYSDGIAAARTMIALEGNAAALQRRLPVGWELEPYTGDDLRGKSLRGANVLVPFHEVYAFRTRDNHVRGLPQASYVAFVSQARKQATGTLAHIHWFTYTEDAAAVPGKYRDAKLADVTRSQSITKERRGETQVRETFSAVAKGGEIHLSLTYKQGGMLVWATADKPNLPLYAAEDPTILRSYQEDQVLDVVQSGPLHVDRVSEFSLKVRGELGDVFDGSERVVAVVIQRPYMRQVYVP
jgi:hypothetical protein